jgi:hypothetical protein
MRCKEEETLHHVLLLLLALIADSEPIAKTISEQNNCEAVLSLFSIIRGPTIPDTQFSSRITFTALTILRALSQSSTLPKVLLL